MQRSSAQAAIAGVEDELAGLGGCTRGISGVEELPDLDSPCQRLLLSSAFSTTISGVDTRISGIWLSRFDGPGWLSVLPRRDRAVLSSALSRLSDAVTPRSLSSRPSGSPARAPAFGTCSMGREFLRSGSVDRTRLLEVCSRISAIKSSMLYQPTEL